MYSFKKGKKKGWIGRPRVVKAGCNVSLYIFILLILYYKKINDKKTRV